MWLASGYRVGQCGCRVGISKCFSKRLGSKYCMVGGPANLCQNYSLPLLERESSQRRYVNERVWPCSTNTLFTKANKDWIGLQTVVCRSLL